MRDLGLIGLTMTKINSEIFLYALILVTQQVYMCNVFRELN